jgi:hypothetical protein
MPPKANPLKLNGLQLRTLALAQVLARADGLARRDPATGEVRLAALPHAHGNHVHIGPFAVSARDASGFANPSVWVALERKGLARRDAASTVLTQAGMEYDTGFGDRFAAPSDH